MSYQQIIYNELKKNGLTESGALGVLGNFQAESCCEPNRLENDYSPYRTTSKDYVNRATSGIMPKSEFCKAIGFGLAQWTFPQRKANLWEFWKNSGKKLDDVYMQIEFAIKELKYDYPELWKLLCTSNDLSTCVKRFCYDFENPLIKNVDTRFRYANEIKQSIDLEGEENLEKPIEINHELILRTIDKNCSGFQEVYLLQSLLSLRKYGVLIDGIWGESLSEAVAEYQKDNNLIVDSIVGKQTWGQLLKI